MAKVEMNLPNADKLHARYDPKPNNEKTKKASVEKRTVKSKFRDSFLSEETGDVGRYILFDVLIPACKDAIADMITGAINMLFYGDKSGRTSSRRERDKSYVSYASYYKREEDRNRPYSRQVGPSKAWKDDYYVNTRQEAEDIINQLVDIIDEYGEVPISKFYSLIGVPSDYTDERYGWTNLAGAYARYDRRRDQFQLCMPRAILID